MKPTDPSRARLTIGRRPTRHDPAVFLAQVPLFAHLPEHVRDELADAAYWKHVPGGEFLFHQGDAADSLALVWSGRLLVIDESSTDGDGIATLPENRVIGLLGRGKWVGELSLLTGEPRSAAVKALRDSELLVLPAAAFTQVLDDEPQLGVTLARALAAQLQSSSNVPSPPTEPDTICVLPLGENLPVDRFVERLARNFATFGPVAVIGDDGAVLQSDGPNFGPIHVVQQPPPAAAPSATGPSVTGPSFGLGDADDLSNSEHHRRWAQRLDELEAQHPWVVLVCADPVAHPQWATFCVRSADRVLALLRGGRPPAWAAEMLSGTQADVVFVGSSQNNARLAPAFEALVPRAHHHLSEGSGFDTACDRVARRASGHSLGLVLSGGGARGLAHLGVLERLVEAGAPIDRVGGCSAGAFAAALFAMGKRPAEMIAICRDELVDRHPFTDFTVSREGLIRGRRTTAMLARVFADLRIEQLSLSFFAVSADLATGQLVEHRTGLVREAIAASMSIPGLSPPVQVDGQLLVDGGLLDNFPVDVMAATGEGPIIGVDVMRAFPLPDGLAAGPAPASGRGASRYRVFRELNGPGIVSTIARSMVLGGWQRSEQNRRAADLLISPAVEGIGLFEFDRIDDAIDAGRRAADEALAHGLPH